MKKGGCFCRGPKKKFPAVHSLQLKSKGEILPEDSLALVPWWLSFTLCFFFFKTCCANLKSSWVFAPGGHESLQKKVSRIE